MKDLRKLVSIIVPVYNPGEYLIKCLDSIINQTYTNLEIILVNDGSTDGSGEICREYALKDARIKVIDQPNQGVVAAKKNGVRIARGDWIGYVDSDDYIEKDYIEQLAELQEESRADIVAVGHFHDIGNNSTVVKNGVEGGIYHISELIDQMLYTGEFFVYGITPQLYTKLFRADILRTAQMSVPDFIVAGDDAAVVYPCLVSAEKIYVSNLAGYHYIQHPGSVTKTAYPGETRRIHGLLDYLKHSFDEKGVRSKLEGQLRVYENYLFALRQIHVFDAGTDAVLTPYGGFHQGERVVIYGAGVLGQKIYSYIKRSGKVEVCGWVDRNWKSYRKNGLEVDAPEKIKEQKGLYDYVIIANITQKTALSMKEYLKQLEVDETKIRWFSEKFLS